MRSNAWQQRVMDVEFIFAARKSLWHRLSADSSSQLKWGLPATRNKEIVAIERRIGRNDPGHISKDFTAAQNATVLLGRSRKPVALGSTLRMFLGKRQRCP